ncbi:hypothetical protein [Planctomyces sp. SH-PL62]|uniref:hypothetical protein n=1 Tax=Planctomyces sp. SH-PL62 TaxID=1636152 RepID=UPI00078E2366|nr:hypothetical protein [Planctomyces sp. SH-PL62]AMV39823.1 hypothetical protein VT85_20495 [Planctomyces sp. SH-PL62]
MGSMSVLPEIRLPLILILLFGGLGVAALVAMYRRNRQIRATADEQFRSFREQAVGLMDQIDALRTRHKTLPSTDPDFVEPMAGATKALYEQVAGDLDRLWERWLAVMEVWNRAEARLKSASTFSVRPSEEARELLSTGRLEDLLRDSSVCKTNLDRLNLAHEVAAKALKDARREASAVSIRVGGGGPSGGAGDLYSRELRVVNHELEEAERILTTDPIGAAELIEGSRDSLADLREPSAPRRPRSGFDSASPSRTILDDLVVAAGKLQELGSKIRVMDVVGLIIKGWVALWVLGLLLAILPALMPLIFLFMIFVVFGSGFRVFQRVSAPWYWDQSALRGRRGRRW